MFREAEIQVPRVETNHRDVDLEGPHPELDDHCICVFWANQKAV